MECSHQNVSFKLFFFFVNTKKKCPLKFYKYVLNWCKFMVHQNFALFQIQRFRAFPNEFPDELEAVQDLKHHIHVF